MPEQPVEVIPYRDHKIEVWYDTDPQNPVTEYDQVGKMVCWHRRYTMGHEQPRISPAEWLHDKLEALDHRMTEWLCNRLGITPDDDWEAWEEWLADADIEKLMTAFSHYNLVLPIYMLDHSGQTISTTPFNDPWDSGQLGFIYASHTDILKEWGDGAKVVDDAILARARTYLQGEVETYDTYIRGEVYGRRIKDSAGEEVDDGSCWGFFGDEGKNEMITEAKSLIDFIVDR